MYFFRKQFDGEWKIFRLKGEDVARTEDLTIDYGIKILRKIKKRAEEHKVELSDGDLYAVMGFFAQKFESFGSDYVEAKVLESKKKQVEGKNPPSS